MRPQKEKWETNNNKANGKHETIDEQIKKDCNKGTALERPVENLPGALTYMCRQTSPLITMQLQLQLCNRYGGPLPHLWNITVNTYTNHYENTPIQIYWKFYHLKMKLFI